MLADVTGAAGCRLGALADQQLDELSLGHLPRHLAVGDDPAIAHDANVIGNFQNLAQMMRDI